MPQLGPGSPGWACQLSTTRADAGGAGRSGSRTGPPGPKAQLIREVPRARPAITATHPGTASMRRRKRADPLSGRGKTYLVYSHLSVLPTL